MSSPAARRLPGEVVDAELIRETEPARMELEHFRAELRETYGEAKANVKEVMEALRRELAVMVDRVDKTLAQEKAGFEARLATLREQQGKARESQRQRIDARIDELKASHEARKTKPEEARQLAKESTEATRKALVP